MWWGKSDVEEFEGWGVNMDLAKPNMLVEREDLAEAIKHRLAGSSEKTRRSTLQRPGKRQKVGNGKGWRISNKQTHRKANGLNIK